MSIVKIVEAELKMDVSELIKAASITDSIIPLRPEDVRRSTSSIYINASRR